jgi:hypothetical protein
MACEAEAGSLAFTDLSRAQSSKLLEVSHGYITTVAGLSDDERALLRAQPWLLALKHKHNRRQREVSNADIAPSFPAPHPSESSPPSIALPHRKSLSPLSEPKQRRFEPGAALFFSETRHK